ncbi:FabD/lysophospholipase-like protein [Xylariaceae sp. AK1471]|nr:FabD/lysophospholipase-like protein [Xylariaceae sp. AK1471]
MSEKQPRWPKAILSLEGGGTRGFASLVILQMLMCKIQELETSIEAPPNIPSDGWEPHNSSFGPIHCVRRETQREMPILQERRSWATINTRGNQNGLDLEEKRREKTLIELEDKAHKYLPCHYFDYIGGTSTGGLAAIMLGRLRMSVDECINRYPTMAKKVFGKERVSFKGILRDRYDAKNLEEEIRSIVHERLPKDGRDALCSRFPSPEDLCKTVVFSKKDGQNDAPYLFRSYEVNDKPELGLSADNPGPAADYEIWQVGRATSAAPPYLKPMNINGVKYVDGAIGYNDPTHQLFQDVLVSESAPRGTRNVISLVLTLGTGLRPTVKERAKGIMSQRYVKRAKKIFHWLEGTVTGTGQVERIMQSEARLHQFHYHKWNGGNEVGALSLDNCKEGVFDDMTEWINAYMSQANRPNELTEIATMLVAQRRERYRQAQDHWERFAFCTKTPCLLQGCTYEFNTRGQVKEHVISSHKGVFDISKLDETIDRVRLIEPWMRGPW